NAQIYVKDTVVISRDTENRARINWKEWHGDEVVYRRVTPGRIDWERLPEIVVLLEPYIGERVVYNPLAGGFAVRTESDARERVRRMWQELYGRQPQVVRPTGPLS